MWIYKRALLYIYVIARLICPHTHTAVALKVMQTKFSKLGQPKLFADDSCKTSDEVK